MSSAVKCDRCGKYFDPKNMGEDVVFTKIGFIRWYTTEDLKHMEYTKTTENMDLCPECSEAFETFMCVMDIPEKKKAKNSHDDFRGCTNCKYDGLPGSCEPFKSCVEEAGKNPENFFSKWEENNILKEHTCLNCKYHSDDSYRAPIGPCGECTSSAFTEQRFFSKWEPRDESSQKEQS